MAGRRTIIEPKWLPRKGRPPKERAQSIVVRDSVWTKVASWTQLAAVVLLGFGLLYSVYPAYQKDLLQESVARLTIEAHELEEAADSARSEERRVRLQVERAQARLELLERDLELQSEAIANAEQERRSALSSLRDAETRHHRLAESAERVAWSIFSAELIDRTSSAFRYHQLLRRQMGFSRAEMGSVEDRIGSLFEGLHFDPWDEVQSILESLAISQAGILLRDLADVDALLDRARSKIDPYREIFVCPEVDQDTWMQRLRLAAEHKASAVSQCVEESWQIRKKEDGWTPRYYARVRRGSFEEGQSAIYEQWCSNDFDQGILNLYQRALAATQEPCMALLIDLRAILDGREPRRPGERADELLQPPEEVPKALPPSVRAKEGWRF